jgi:hypothetical protein
MTNIKKQYYVFVLLILFAFNTNIFSQTSDFCIIEYQSSAIHNGYFLSKGDITIFTPNNKLFINIPDSVNISIHIESINSNDTLEVIDSLIISSGYYCINLGINDPINIILENGYYLIIVTTKTLYGQNPRTFFHAETLLNIVK